MHYAPTKSQSADRPRGSLILFPKSYWFPTQLFLKKFIGFLLSISRETSAYSLLMPQLGDVC